MDEAQLIRDKITQLESQIGQIQVAQNKNVFSELEVFDKKVHFNNRIRVKNLTALPAACEVGEMIFVNGVLYFCYTANEWTVWTPGVATFTANESVTAGQAVALGDGLSYGRPEIAGSGSTDISNNGNEWFSQKFTTSAVAQYITAVDLSIIATGTGTYNGFHVMIYANSGGKPTGTALATIQPTINVYTSYTMTRFTFSSPLAVSQSTDYHIVWWNGNNLYNVERSNGGGAGTNASTDGGSTWNASNGPEHVRVYEITTASGQVSRTSAAWTSDRLNNFVGFTRAACSNGELVPVQIYGIYDGLSSLSVGYTYYLADGYGTISTSAGTVSKKIGLSTSATDLLIKNDN